MIYYKVTRDDFLAPKFPYSEVLQNVYVGNKYSQSFESLKNMVKSLRERVLTNKVTIEEVNKLIRDKVIELEYKYPNEFPANTLGSYSKKVLTEKFMEGSISINGYTVKDMLAEKDEIVSILVVKNLRSAALLEDEELAKQERYRTKREQRVPLHVGMLFCSKDGMARAFEDQYPSNIKLSAIIKEINNSLTAERGKFGVDYGYNRFCWRITEVRIDGGLAYLDDIIETGA